MRFYELLEGVALANPVDAAAFILAVAEAYDAAPEHDPAADPSYAALTKHTVTVLFKRLQPAVKIEFTETDPYSINVGDTALAVRRMLYDMVVNQRLKIWSGSSEHPFFTPQENHIFRTVHDFYTHAKLIRPFTLELKKLMAGRNRPPTDAELMQLLPQIDLNKHGNIGQGFNFRGELNALSTHGRLAPPAALPALFCEVIGQVCYFSACGAFPEQKAAILHGFDYQHLGRAIPGTPQAARMTDIVQQIRQGAAEIASHIKGHPVVSSKALIAAARERA